MMTRKASNTCTVSCPATSAKAVVSFAYSNAVRFFSALRFYFYGYYYYYFKKPSAI